MADSGGGPRNLGVKTTTYLVERNPPDANPVEGLTPIPIQWFTGVGTFIITDVVTNFTFMFEIAGGYGGAETINSLKNFRLFNSSPIGCTMSMTDTNEFTILTDDSRTYVLICSPYFGTPHTLQKTVGGALALHLRIVLKQPVISGLFT